MIERGEYREVLKHPTRPNQRIFVIHVDEYTWAVPFVLDDDGAGIFLKTAFPSRRFHRLYGGSK